MIAISYRFWLYIAASDPCYTILRIDLLTRSSGAGGGSDGEVIRLGLPSGVGGARRGWDVDIVGL